MQTPSKHLLLVVLAVFGPAACGGDDDDDGSLPDLECAEADAIDGTCVGVPAEPVCDAAVCTDDVECSEVLEVAAPGELAAAIDAAASGACVALAPGSYDAVTLPSDVSLLGRSAQDVRVEGVVIEGGAVTLRGLQVGIGGVRIADDARVLVEASEIVGPSDDAFLVGRGATLSLRTSTLREAGGLGVRAMEPGAIAIERSIVQDSGGPGVWVEASTACAGGALPEVSITLTVVRRNRVVGAALVGVAAAIDHSRIVENPVAADFASSGGLAVMGCSDLRAVGLEVSSNAGFGILVDGSTAVLGGADGDGVMVADNLIGLWVQDGDGAGTASVEVTGSRFLQNRGVSVGVTGVGSDLALRATKIESTTAVSLPVFDVTDGAGVEEVGDAIDWLGGARVAIEDVTLRDDARAAILIDGAVPAASSIRGLVLEGTDADFGIVQQNIGVGTPIEAGDLQVSSFPTRQVPIPRAVAAPQQP